MEKIPLTKEKLQKTGKSFLISAVAYIAIRVIEQVTQFDFGAFNEVIAAFAPFVVNFIRLWANREGVEVLAGIVRR